MVGDGEGDWTTASEHTSVSGDLRKYILKKLETGKKYTFRIAALNKAGSSPFSELGPVVCAATVGKWAIYETNNIISDQFI